VTSNREQLHWQFRAVRVLEKLLKTAGRDDLPAITWTVGNAGAVLVGRCYGRRASTGAPSGRVAVDAGRRGVVRAHRVGRDPPARGGEGR
jgi:hypothetical protein